MKEVTRYHNSLNTIPMRLWTTEEQNFFFAILTQIRDEGHEIITFDKFQLKEFADYTNKNAKDFKKTMDSLADKLMTLRYREETSHSLKIMALFQSFETNWNDDYSDMSLEVQISNKFEYIVNQLKANFTQFELEQFTNLRSTYAKAMFRYIKQWRTKGRIGGFPDGEIPKKELFVMLDVPKSMQRADNFKNKVLKPILTELSPLFTGLKIKPIKARKAGNPIIAYKITWKPERTGEFVSGKFDKDKKQGKILKDVPEWTDEYKLNKAGYDTTGLSQNEMYRLAREKGLK